MYLHDYDVMHQVPSDRSVYVTWAIPEPEFNGDAFYLQSICQYLRKSRVEAIGQR